MLHLSSWTATLPILVIGMVGILLVMGVLVLAVMLLNKLTHRDYGQTLPTPETRSPSRSILPGRGCGFAFSFFPGSCTLPCLPCGQNCGQASMRPGDKTKKSQRFLT